jgi:mannitol/fructose-specific phosphotransferase system IIA component (Ntr-type)
MTTTTSTTRLSQFFSPDSITFNLRGSKRDDILEELVSLLRLDPGSHAGVFEMLKRRENLASTGIGRGFAIPHCRTRNLTRLRAAYAHKPEGVEFRAIDERPVYDFFLIVAPPLEISNDYLPMLGQVAQFVKQPDVPVQLAQLKSTQQFFDLLDEMSG